MRNGRPPPGPDRVVFLLGGEAVRLLRFEGSEDRYSWTYALEFAGEVPMKYRTANG